jgi:tetratricopeptide (TPR) repeat protein
MRFEAAVAIRPTHPEFLRDLGRVLRDLARWDEAVECFRRTAALQGDSPSLCCDLAFALSRSGDLDGAARAWKRAVELEPSNVSYHLQYFAALHRAGDFRRAWEEYEWRLQVPNGSVAFDSPRWDGSLLDGRRILIHAEQGLGDQIQFIRYAPMVAALGGRVIVHCGAPLVRLARTCRGVEDAVVAFGKQPVPDHDVHVWSGSLPRIFATTDETVPADVPYLFPDSEQVERWRKALAHFGGVRVGINWEGNRANVQGRNRAIPLAAFHPLGRVEGVHLFSLQQGEPAEQLQEVPDDLRIVNLGQFFGNLWVTAAVMGQLDLVVTNDTSLAHLAGALGRPVWVVLHEDACWRWRESGEGSRWYPTMRLFRRSHGEDWPDVLARVKDELENLCAGVGHGRCAPLHSA